MKCTFCGYDIPLENVEVKFYGMYDCHAFTRFYGKTVDEIIEAWREHNANPGRYGPAYLCPVKVIGTNPNNDKRVERAGVGEMVFPASENSTYHTPEREAKDLAKWREAVEADDEIMRLLENV